MGIARLLAKGWVTFCLFAGAHALRLALLHGEEPADITTDVFAPVALFTAMGLLFIAGYGAFGSSAIAWRTRFKPRHLVPGFDELVFVAFVLLSFINQVFIAPAVMESAIAGAISTAIGALIPGQGALEDQLYCGLDGGRVFASAFTWVLALIYFASAVSRIALTAGLIRMARTARPEALGSLPYALVLGALAIGGIQLFLVGSIYSWLPCSAFTDISGALLIGLAPLMLAYLIIAAIAGAMATGPES